MIPESESVAYRVNLSMIPESGSVESTGITVTSKAQSNLIADDLEAIEH